MASPSLRLSSTHLCHCTCMASVRSNANRAMVLLLLCLCCLIFFPHSSSQFAHAADTLTQGQSLPDGQTLLSARRIFELGFFSPGNSTGRYVGIWYHDISPRTAVWVANRELPLPDSSGGITIGSDGNLIVFNGERDTIWSSNASMTATPNNSSVKITDDGNLVLRGNMGSIVWQSFDHPTDTYLPDMKLGLNTRTGVNQVFTSWRSDDDPAPGNFSLGVDPNGSTQFFIWEGSEPYWRSGRWNGQTFIGIPTMTPYTYAFDLSDEHKVFLSYTAFGGALARFVLRWDGTDQLYVWLKDAKVWNMRYWHPSNKCEIYNHCGSYGQCSYSDDGTPRCSCLRGFEPRYIDEWRSGNWTGGCIRRTPLACGRRNSTNKDEFLRVEGMKLPDFSNRIVNYFFASECEDECLKDCSCMAYAFFGGMGCFVWNRELVDLYQFPSGGYTLYLRLADSELVADKRRNIFKIVALVTTLGAILLATFAYILWRWKNRAKDDWKNEREEEMLLFYLGVGEEVTPEIVGSENLRDGKRRKIRELVLFKFDTISVSTNNFCDSNKLGEGGFGPVYKGKLPSGQEIAVKRLSKSSEQGLEEFKNEVTLMARLQHRNIVRLLGCCIQAEEKMLLYEYLPNKSLDAFFREPSLGSSKQLTLDWANRLCIIQGVARGLLYLHEDSRQRIVHRDLKASNILLDEEMNPKISDFGMARIFGGGQNQANTKRVFGTFGYMAPEYAMGGSFSVKSDVYSFGVVLLEVVSGKKNNTFCHYETSQNLLSYAWQLWNEGRAEELIDSSIEDTFSPSEALRCIRVGLLCIQDRPDDRPTMSLVVLMLGSDTSIQTIPKQPTFTPKRRLSGSDPSTDNLEAFFQNDVTITMITGR